MSDQPDKKRPIGKAVDDEDPDFIPMEEDDASSDAPDAEKANKAMQKKTREGKKDEDEGVTSQTLRTPPD